MASQHQDYCIKPKQLEGYVKQKLYNKDYKSYNVYVNIIIDTKTHL